VEKAGEKAKKNLSRVNLHFGGDKVTILWMDEKFFGQILIWQIFILHRILNTSWYKY
jgi:hypothetical protein